MNRLLKFREIVPKLRFCGILFDNTKCTRIMRIPSSRSVMSRTSEKLASKLKSRDMIGKDFVLVYRGGMDNYVLACQWGWMIMMSLGTGSLYSMFLQDEPVQFPIETVLPSTIGLQNYTELGIMYGTFFAMIFVMRLISIRYVLRMYYNAETNTFRAVRNGIFPTYTKTLDFPANTLERKRKTSFIPWWNIQYACNGTKIFIFDYGFKTSADYYRMFKD